MSRVEDGDPLVSVTHRSELTAGFVNASSAINQPVTQATISRNRQSRSAEQGGRIVGIDAGKFLAIAAVVVIHTLAAPAFEYDLRTVSLVDQAMRWSVPFFFISSGYFLARHDREPLLAASRAILVRLGPVFLVWSMVYIVPSRGGLSRLAQPQELYLWVVTGGPAWHLWFLTSLATCALSLFLMRHLNFSLTAIVAVALSIYTGGLLLGPYQGWLSGMPVDRMQLEARLPLLDGRGGLFPLIFVVLGYGLAKARSLLSVRIAVILFAAGGGLHIAEAFYLDNHGWYPFARNDFLIGTLAFGAGAFLLAQRIPAGSATAVLARLGTYSLGIYVSHLLFVILLRKLLPPSGTVADLLLAVAVLFVSTALVVGIARFRPLRPLVM